MKYFFFVTILFSVACDQEDHISQLDISYNENSRRTISSEDDDPLNKVSKSVVKIFHENGIFVCSGVAIGSNTVASAAHCFQNSILYEVLFQDEEKTCPIRTLGIYKKSDIAILKIECETKYFISDYADEIGLNEPLTLLSYETNSKSVVISQDEECKTYHKIDGFIYHRCDATFGSSGGPLFKYIDKRYVLAGIQSSGPKLPDWWIESRDGIFSLASILEVKYE